MTTFFEKIKNGIFGKKEEIKEPKKKRDYLRYITKEKNAEYARIWRANNREKYLADSRKKDGTGELADPNNVIFYGYKEPLKKFEGGFGYEGVLTYKKDTKRIQCHFCGRFFKFLNNGHLGKIHGMSAAEYKEKVGLSPVASLVSEETRLKLLKRGHNPNHMEELKKIQQKRRDTIQLTGKDPQSHPKMRLEIKNKRGTCPDQLLDIIDKTIKSHGKVMTAEEFLKFHNGKYMGSIRETFGTWTKALSKLNKRPVSSGVRYSDDELLDSLRNFYKVHGRTARFSDFQRGLVISPTPYYKRFKNLNHARLLAGVPLIIDMGNRIKEEWLPTEQERLKMLEKYV